MTHICGGREVYDGWTAGVVPGWEYENLLRTSGAASPPTVATRCTRNLRPIRIAVVPGPGRHPVAVAFAWHPSS
jgi:hypothetical protein